MAPLSTRRPTQQSRLVRTLRGWPGSRSVSPPLHEPSRTEPVAPVRRGRPSPRIGLRIVRLVVHPRRCRTFQPGAGGGIGRAGHPSSRAVRAVAPAVGWQMRHLRYFGTAAEGHVRGPFHVRRTPLTDHLPPFGVPLRVMGDEAIPTRLADPHPGRRRPGRRSGGRLWSRFRRSTRPDRQRWPGCAIHLFALVIDVLWRSPRRRWSC